MPGFELFDQREIDAVADVLRRRIVHRYSFQGVRDGIYKVEEFEGACAGKFGSRYALGVSSGSAALYVALKACDLEEGLLHRGRRCNPWHPVPLGHHIRQPQKQPPA